MNTPAIIFWSLIGGKFARCCLLIDLFYSLPLTVNMKGTLCVCCCPYMSCPVSRAVPSADSNEEPAAVDNNATWKDFDRVPAVGNAPLPAQLLEERY
jgi:hypothetical protein